MIENLDLKKVSKGTIDFIGAAMSLISENRAKTPKNELFRETAVQRVARTSLNLKLTSNAPATLQLDEEILELQDLLRVARNLAQAARQDERWGTRPFDGDPVKELEDLLLTARLMNVPPPHAIVTGKCGTGKSLYVSLIPLKARRSGVA